MGDGGTSCLARLELVPLNGHRVGGVLGLVHPWMPHLYGDSHHGRTAGSLLGIFALSEAVDCCSSDENLESLAQIDWKFA